MGPARFGADLHPMRCSLAAVIITITVAGLTYLLAACISSALLWAMRG